MQGDKAQELLCGLGLITVINKRIASSDEMNTGPGMPSQNILRVTSVDYADGGYAFLTNLDEINSMVLQPNFDQLLANTMDAPTAATTIHAGLQKYLDEAAKQQP